jgi:Flp pilus assembly pilin Flp
MAVLLYNLWREEDGQDLIEYSLLITFIAIACAALVGSGRPAVNTIWQAGNNHLQQASNAAAGS